MKFLLESLSLIDESDLGLTTLQQLKGKSLSAKSFYIQTKGFQYTSRFYAQHLRELRIISGYSRCGNGSDNVCIKFLF